jgi:hypothetical protein
MEVSFRLSFLLLFLFFSCSSIVQKLSPEVFYNYDLQINGVSGSGTLPFAERYTFEITAPAEMDLLSITTCHREFTAQPKAKSYTYEYTPRLERNRFCPVYFSAYNREGRTSFGMVLPENPKYKQPAIIECNGKIWSPVGTAVCESKFGLKQRITFPDPVMLARPVTGPATRKDPCPALEGVQAFEFSLPARECVYQFKNVETEQMFLLYTIGHEQIIVR